MEPLISPEMAARIVDALRERHPGLGDLEAEVTAWQEETRVVASVELYRADDTLHVRLEAAVEMEAYPSLSDALDLGLDFLDWSVGEYLERQVNPLWFGRDWQTGISNNQTICVT